MGPEASANARGAAHRQYAADVAAIDANGRVLALGSCKWRDESHDAGELDKLKTVAELVGAADPQLLFFDRTGFSPRLRELARERGAEHVRLVRVDDLAG